MLFLGTLRGFRDFTVLRGGLCGRASEGALGVECGDVSSFLFFEYLADGEEYA